MDNYQRTLEYARKLFLKWDQEQIIARCRLRSDDFNLYLNFLGTPWRIQRSNGVVRHCKNEAEANFSQALSIYDYLCRQEPLPTQSECLCKVNSLPHVAQSNPNTAALHRPYADYFQLHSSNLKKAVNQIGISPFYKGDAACTFAVFDDLNAVFQFWEGDEDFPPSVCFLWPENAQSFLKYETLYYVMDCFLKELKIRITEIEKNM